MGANSLPTVDEHGHRLRWQCRCRQNGGVMVQPWRQGDVIAEWRPLEKFSARAGSIVLRRWKTREAGDWKYGLIEDWRPVAVGGWQYDDTSEFLLIGSSR